MLYRKGDILRILPSWTDCCKRYGWNYLLSVYKPGYLIEYSDIKIDGANDTGEGENLCIVKNGSYYIPSNHVELVFPERFIIADNFYLRQFAEGLTQGQVLHIRPLELDKINTLQENVFAAQENVFAARYSSRTRTDILVITNLSIKELLNKKHIIRF